MMAWVDQQLRSRSPQTLLVPAQVLGKDVQELSEEPGNGSEATATGT